jgi:hypothetical protein
MNQRFPDRGTLSSLWLILATSNVEPGEASLSVDIADLLAATKAVATQYAEHREGVIVQMDDAAYVGVT